jgi:S1-C subfamily serine protease
VLFKGELKVALKLSRYLQLFILVFLFNSHAYAEDWQLLFNRSGDGKAIEYEAHSIKADQGLIFLNIRYSPRAGVTSLFNNVAFHMESIVVSCERESYAVAVEADALKNGSIKIKKTSNLPDLSYISPPLGSEPAKIIKVLCEVINKPQPNTFDNKVEYKPSRIIDADPSKINWRFITRATDDNSMLFAQIESITRLSESEIFVISKYEHQSDRKTPTHKTFRYTLWQSLIACDAKSMAIVSSEYFAPDHGMVEGIYYEVSEVTWQTINPNSLVEALHSTVCPIGMSKEIFNPNQQESQNKESSGTAWQITNKELVTAHHVIDGATQVYIMVDKEDYRLASVIAADPANDIAILRIKDKPLTTKPLKISTKLPKLGSRVAALGYPLIYDLGTKIQATTGEVSGLSGYKDDQREFQISAPIQGGNSGGPLLNSEGDVIGIVTSGLSGEFMKKTGQVPQNIGFALKYYYVKALIDSAGIKLPTSSQNKISKIEDAINNAQDSVYLVIAK